MMVFIACALISIPYFAYIYSRTIYNAQKYAELVEERKKQHVKECNIVGLCPERAYQPMTVNIFLRIGKTYLYN